MPLAGVGISTAADARGAAREAADAALRAAGLSAAEAALLYATPDHAESARELLGVAAARLGTGALAGGSVHGLLGPGLARERGPAVAVVALAGGEPTPFLLRDLDSHEGRAGVEIAACLGRPPGAEDLVVLHADPYGLAMPPLLDGLAEALGPAAVVGLATADAPGSAPLAWCGETVATGALGGLVLRSGAPPVIGVTQAGRPATDLLVVTRGRGHWVQELDGRPALEVFREVAREPLAADLRRAAASVLVALPQTGGGLARGGYIVREIAGFDEKENAFALPDRVGTGDSLALAVREPEAAREDLKALLAELAGPAALALFFGCRSRGAALFGHEGLEGGYLESALGRVPHLGLMGSSQLGPVAGRTRLLTHAGVLALLAKA